MSELTWTVDNLEQKGIIEYVGAHGVIASRHVFLRMKKPQPGDPVDLREYKAYMRSLGKGGYDEDPHYILCHDWGRIERLNWMDDGDVHICVGGASVFLSFVQEEWRCSVSISGGPFELHQQHELVPTGKLKKVRFWNFRDGEARAHNGQDFFIYRPEFKLVKDGMNEAR